MLIEHLSLSDTLDEAIARAGQERAHRRDPPPDPPRTPVPRAPEGQKHATEPEAHTHPDQEQEHDAPSLNWAHAIVLLWSSPGIRRRAAEGMRAEIGLALSRFPSAGHLASWAGMCPGNNERAGTRLSGKTTKGSPWVRNLLVEAAHAAAHPKTTSLSALYRRIAARHGAKKAMMAVGHAIFGAISYMLDRNESSQALGGTPCDERNRHVTEKRLVRRVEKLGSHGALQEVAQIA
jgi:transposase